MIHEKPFAKGVKSLLNVRWQLKLAAPLCIKSGYKSAFQPTDQGSKSRNTGMSFIWNAQNKRDKDVDVSDFHIGAAVINGRAEPRYIIPASSVRGALRSWTVSRLVDEQHQRLLAAPENVNDLQKKMEEALSIDNGAALAADCFGIASDAAESSLEGMARAGRFRINVEPLAFDLNQLPPTPLSVQGNDWKENESSYGPPNAFRHITVRGPVDRLTHSAKEGGLHYFLELSPGQSFTVNISVVNPSAPHMGLISVWEREIQEGMLRLGGLRSVGRGRLLVEKKEYLLHRLTGYNNEWPEDTLKKETMPEKEVFSDIWDRYSISDADAYVSALEAYYYSSPESESQEAVS